MKIPEKIKIMGHHIIINFDDKVCKDKNTLGEADYDYDTILLCKNYEGKPLPEDKINYIFWHETVHHCLCKLGYTELRKDEQFVEAFSGILYQVIKQVINTSIDKK